MVFPFVSSITAGCVLILQIVLAFLVSGGRGKVGNWIGDGGHDSLLRASRRHANLAENSGIFIAGFTLLELSHFNLRVLVALCDAFVFVRLMHVIWLSQVKTNNPFRLIGGVGTYFLGLSLGGLLVAAGVSAVTTSL